MSIIVQKFGGTSVADSQKIRAAARRAIRAQAEGHQVVMVVSAMGKNTDMLVQLAHEVSESPPAREMDMLLSTGEQVSVALMAMAIDSMGHKAVSLTGAQIGIRTDSTHTKARIRTISTERMQRLLDDGNIVIAAGFQGIDEEFNITTLGRGGSDTTAVALAAVLNAEACEINTDVDGVYTTDPRVLAEARMLKRVSYDEMLELASLGAGVMHSRSIEFAKKYGVPIHVRSSMTDQPGTMIVSQPECADQPVGGAAITRNEARITVRGVPDVPGTSLEIFSRIADRKITVDMIVQNVGEQGKSDLSFTVPADELPGAMQAVEEAARALGAGEVSADDQVSKVSVVGLGMARQTGVARTMFDALAENEINIQMITTSEIKISVLVEKEQGQKALSCVHQAFELQRTPARIDDLSEATRDRADVSSLVERLRGVDMEELVVDAVELDDSQGRITITDIPDRPGVAARIFRRVGEAGIFVDMIVQSYKGYLGQTSLSFTVPSEDIQPSLDVARQLGAELGCGQITSSPHIAKLSVSGVGLRSHTSVAIRMFRSLAEAGINVEMINTSEVRVNVVVEGSQGPRALKCLQAAFANVLR